MRSSRSTPVHQDEELRLPRPPGVFRRFWARHPVAADVIITLLCLFLSLTPATNNTLLLASPLGEALRLAVPAIVILACATLLWRRRLPLLPFVAAFAAETAYLFVTLPLGTPLLMVASYGLAVYGSSKAAWRGFGLAMTALAAISAALTAGGVISGQIALNAVASSLVLCLIGTLIGVNVGGRKRYVAAIIDRSRQLLVERDQQAQLAAAAERARIAREMHDIVSHSLTVIVALSEGAAATSNPEQARKAASSAADTARDALDEMRAMLGVLREEGAPLPLAPADPASPQETVAVAQRAGYPVTLSITGNARPSPAVAHAVGRIVQEGVTNAMRHGPTATSIDVRLTYAEDAVRIEIANDGATAPIGESGFGLQGLAERATHVRGEFSSQAIGDGRWLLRARLPRTANDSTVSAGSDGRSNV